MLKSMTAGLCALTFLTACNTQSQSPPHQATNNIAPTFHNPILPGFYPDPAICRVGDDYYLVNSSFEYYPGIPIHHSKDLVHWQQIGYVLNSPSQCPLDHLKPSEGVFAPTIAYHDGTFYVANLMVGSLGTFIVTATNPAGLLVMLNNNFHYRFLKTLTPTGPQLQVIKREKGIETTLATASIPNGPLELRISAKGQDYAFSYRTENAPWKTLVEKADGRILTTRACWGFTGVMLAMYTTSANHSSTNHADFDYFTYHGDDGLNNETLSWIH